MDSDMMIYVSKIVYSGDSEKMREFTFDIGIFSPIPANI